MTSLSNAMLGFEAAGVRLIAPVASIERVVEVRAPLRVPFAGPGLVGLHLWQEQVVPVYDLGAFVRGQPAPQVDGDILAALMGAPAGRLALQLRSLPNLVPSSHRSSREAEVLAALPARLRNCVTGALETALGDAFFFAVDLFADSLAQRWSP